jgi:hypothetical protein
MKDNEVGTCQLCDRTGVTLAEDGVCAERSGCLDAWAALAVENRRHRYRWSQLLQPRTDNG